MWSMANGLQLEMEDNISSNISRVPSTYFIKCSWGIPYLHKCPAGTSRWSQELHACISDEVAPAPAVSSGGYGGYGSQQVVSRVAPQISRPQITQSVSSGYGAQPQITQSQGGY